MSLYTKTGDKGETGLFGNKRVPKNNPRIEACGAIDELNACVGHVRTLLEKNQEYDAKLKRIQEELFVVGAILATPEGAPLALPKLEKENIARLEREIDEWEKNLPAQKHFILPTGVPAASFLHITRTCARRAERNIVTFLEKEKTNENILPYINRLSDWFFILARTINQAYNTKEDDWIPKKTYAGKTKK